MRIPKYREWTTRNKGFVDWQGQRVYFPGAYGSPESLQAYQEWIANTLHAQLIQERLEAQQLTMADLAASYLRHCQLYYGDGPRGSIVNIKAAIRGLLDAEQGGLLVNQYGPKQLKAYQQHLINAGLARRTINDRAAWIKAMLKWGVAEEMVPPEVYQAATTVPGLAKGRTQAHEPPPRQPVAWRDVEAILDYLSPVVRAMLMLQWHTGARSGSIVQARPEQFCEDPDHPQLLLWRPRHKTEWRGKELILPIGPQCRADVGAYLNIKPLCFSPRMATTKGKPGVAYQPWTYRRALVRAQSKAQAAAQEALQRGEAAYLPASWTPHQLRHAKAQLVRDKWGVEAAQAILGHDSLEATQIYSQRRLDLARQVALQMG